jgi:hypothetical protein
MSFRQFGGTTFAAKNNIVSNKYNTSNNLLVTQNVGQPNSFINFESDISSNFIGITGPTGPTGSPATSTSVTSDYRIKKDVISLNNSFLVDNLNPVTYFNLNTNKQDIGLIAHELQEIYPTLVNGIKDGDTMQSVNYIGLIPVLIKEIQELKNDIKKIKEEFSFFKNNKIEIKS